MFEDFREWLSDYLRYILLGLAVILVIVVVFFAVKMLKGSDSSETNNGTTESVTETSDPDLLIQDTADTTQSADDVLQKDAYPEVNQLINTYFTAMTTADIDTLNTVVVSLSEEDKEKINITKDYIESYNNISCYTKNGLEDNSYFVFVYYELKFYDTEGLLPNLRALYVCTSDSGQLYLSSDWNSDETIKSYYESLLENDEAIVALKSGTIDKYNAALEANGELNAEATKLAAALGGDTQQSGVASDIDIQTNKVVTALNTCNIRSDSTIEAEVLGVLEAGATITRVQVLDNGWTEVKYGTGNGYVKSEFLSE